MAAPHLLGCCIHYIYIFGGSCPLTEFCPVQNSLCVQVLRSHILSALLHGTPAAGVSQTLRRLLYSAGRPSRWASAHILVLRYFSEFGSFRGALLNNGWRRRRKTVHVRYLISWWVSCFRTVVEQLTRLQRTQVVARPLCDSWAFCPQIFRYTSQKRQNIGT